MAKEGLLFTKTHEWAKVEGDTAIVGITDHAQHQLGDIVFVELPKAGDNVKQSESFGTIESTKAASDLYSPFSGQVLEANPELLSNPALVNQDPYEKGWMIKIKMSSREEAKNLLDATAYDSLLKEEQH